MAKDPISLAASSILLPSMEAAGFRRLTNRITARIVDDILQFLSVHVSRRGTKWFSLEYASICLFRPRDQLPLQPGGTIVRASETGSFLQQLFRSKGKRVAFDGTRPESAISSMTEGAGLVAMQAMPFFAKTRSTLLLYEQLQKEQWGSDHHLRFEMGCCLARLQRLPEAEKMLKQAMRLYEKDGRDWCGTEAERVNALLAAIKEKRSDECLTAWTRASVANLELDALSAENLAQQTVPEGAFRATRL